MLTGTAYSEKVDPVMTHKKPASFLCFGVEAGVGRKIEVLDGPARFADEVVVGGNVAVVAVERAAAGQFAYTLLFSEDREIAVHRPHAQIGQFLFEGAVDLVRGRVSIRAANHLEDAVALF